MSTPSRWRVLRGWLIVLGGAGLLSAGAWRHFARIAGGAKRQGLAAASVRQPFSGMRPLPVKDPAAGRFAGLRPVAAVPRLLEAPLPEPVRTTPPLPERTDDEGIKQVSTEWTFPLSAPSVSGPGAAGPPPLPPPPGRALLSLDASIDDLLRRLPELTAKEGDRVLGELARRGWSVERLSVARRLVGANAAQRQQFVDDLPLLPVDSLSWLQHLAQDPDADVRRAARALLLTSPDPSVRRLAEAAIP